MGAKKVSVKERSNINFVKKLIGKHGVAARGIVVDDLDKMLTFSLAQITDAMASISSNYSKKEGTIKPKVAQGALLALLGGGLRKRASEAGAGKLLEFATQNEKKATARAAKKSAKAETTAQ
jgi:hypothetical protein